MPARREYTTFVIMILYMVAVYVCSVKAVGIALKLTLEGENQLVYFQTYAFIAVVAVCVVFQMHYLNKALDVYNTAVVTPICQYLFTWHVLSKRASSIRFASAKAQP